MSGARHARRALFTALWVAAFAASFALCAFGMLRTLDRAGVEVAFIDMDCMSLVEPQLAALDRPRDRADELRVALLSDSTAMYFFDRPRGLESRLEPALAVAAPGGPPYRVTSFAVPAFTVFVHYFLAEQIARAHPDRVVLSFNLHELGDRMFQVERAQLAGWLPRRALPQALRLPLHVIGLSTDELLLYTSVVRLGGYEPWRRLSREQTRWTKGWEQLEQWLQRATWPAGLGYRERIAKQRSAAMWVAGPPQRETPWMVRHRLGPALDGIADDHPALQMLGAALDVFRARGIPVLVYTPPLNVEYHTQIGVYARGALTPTVAAVRRVSEAHGARFLDLHAALPDAAFEDGSSHLTAGTPLDAQSMIAGELARAVLELPAAR